VAKGKAPDLAMTLSLQTSGLYIGLDVFTGAPVFTFFEDTVV
jgi:hypothetical protein